MKTKTQPLQERSRQTFEAILTAAAGLLEEVGIERFSTNLVCQRAHLTPPALYRYFPNKYALLKELGARLMEAQDQVVYDWIDRGGLDAQTPEAMFRSNLRIQQRVNDVTRQHPASLWILRALRAVPTMRDVRIASRAEVADRLFRALRHRYPNTPASDLKRALRLNLELSMAVTEMLLEEPGRDGTAILKDLARMIVLSYQRFS